MFVSQVQRPFSPSSTSERQGHKLLGVPRGIYQGIQKSFFFKWKYLRKLIFKSVFQGVFWKDNAKGFLNLLSKEPVRIFK